MSLHDGGSALEASVSKSITSARMKPIGTWIVHLNLAVQKRTVMLSMHQRDKPQQTGITALLVLRLLE